MQAFTLTPDQLEEFLATGKMPAGATPFNLSDKDLADTVLKACGVDAAADDATSRELNVDLVIECGARICEALGSAIGVNADDNRETAAKIVKHAKARLEGIATVAYSLGNFVRKESKADGFAPPTRDEIITERDADQIDARVAEMCGFFLSAFGQPRECVLAQNPKGAAIRSAAIMARKLATDLFRDAYVRALALPLGTN